MTEEQFDRTFFRRGSVVITGAFPLVAQEFEVAGINFRKREILGMCSKGYYNINCEDILSVRTDVPQIKTRTK